MRPHGKYARVDPQNPEHFAQCDRCGFLRNGSDLAPQMQWAGTHLFNTGALVCVDRCLDVPNEQLRTIILPNPDPPPVFNARVPNFAYEEQTVMIGQYGGPDEPPWGAGPQMILCTQDGEMPLILQYLTSS